MILVTGAAGKTGKAIITAAAQRAMGKVECSASASVTATNPLI
jgi:uncharacterized protein YbjT (DUF2867 family)